ncbi:MAG: cupin domain-containing protein [Methanolobus sp.]|nr:cupin domain-containing protein [Methanolobus sp.]
MPIKNIQQKIESYITRDGSSIRELMHPGVHGNHTQSLAEATVPVGCSTIPHRHINSEEIYNIMEGCGYMTIEGKGFDVGKGDTICILPGETHNIRNTGNIPLKLLCCCSPPYSHDDTELAEQ